MPSPRGTPTRENEVIDLEAETGADQQNPPGDDTYARSAVFVEQVAKATAVGVVHGILQKASEGGGASSSGEPKTKLQKPDVMEFVAVVESARAAAAHASQLSIAAAQAFKNEEQTLAEMKKKLHELVKTM